MFRNIIKRILHQIRISLGIIEIKNDLNVIKNVTLNNYISSEIRENIKYKNKKNLNRFEYQIFSQYGEDGIINEIFNRIKTTNKFFVEIGAGEGLENNTINLLVNNWKGLWIDSNLQLVENTHQFFSDFIRSEKLKVINKFVTSKNISDIIKNTNIPIELDLLSIDIDGNDYWIWKELSFIRPRVVVIEYNSALGPTAKWIMKYNKNHKYKYTNYFGASLKSLELLGRQLGYNLVACSFAGTNAFFVRNNLTKNNFIKPYISENFYETPKYFLYREGGHPKDFNIFKDFIKN